MQKDYPNWPFFLVIIAGFCLQFTGALECFPYPQIILGFLIGGLFGFIWPKVSWRWGLWMVGPILGLLVLSLLFAGNFDVFLEKDLPVPGVTFLSASMGGFVFSKWKESRSKKE